MSEGLVLPFFPYEVGARSREEVRKVHQRNREKILAHRVKFASFRQRLAEAGLRGSRRSKEMIRRSVVSSRRRSQEISALAAIDYSIAEERMRDNMLRSASRIKSQLLRVRKESRRKAREAVSEEGIRGRVDRTRKGMDQVRVRLASDISATRKSSLQATGRGFRKARGMMLTGKEHLLTSRSELTGALKDRWKIIENAAGREFERARAMMLMGKENFRIDSSEVRESNENRWKIVDDARNVIRRDKANFEGGVTDARIRLRMCRDTAGRLMAQNLIGGAGGFREEKTAATKRFEHSRAEITEKRRSFKESISAADHRFKLKGEEVEQRRKAPTLEAEAIAISRKDQLEARGKELGKKFRESLEAAKDSFIARVSEKREIMMRRSKAIMEQGQVRRNHTKKNITNRKALFVLDVRFAQYRLGEASKRLRRVGDRTVERLAARREGVLRRTRAEQKARLIRNALALIHSMS